MKEKILRSLEKLKEIEEELGKASAFEDQKRYRQLTQDHAHLSQLKVFWDQKVHLEKQLEESNKLLHSEEDPEFLSVIEEDIASLTTDLESVEIKLKNLLVPKDPHDDANTILELRAGTGGEEAALFVGDCVRMYRMFAEKRGLKLEELSATLSDLGGFKEYIMAVSGKDAWRLFQYERGTHRVQRVPDTETQGRVHTSAITVAVLREPDEFDEDINIQEKELRIDTYRASGAGGQHVNVTDSAVRITHLPTGVVVQCQDERSQHKNKQKAMRFLKAKIVERQRILQEQERASDRAEQIGTGDRSEKIRTYNFPQNRITDHRINLTKYNLDRALEGDLDDVIDALIVYFAEKKLRE